MKTAKVFRGEGDLMVDALVAASQARVNTNGNQLPGFGRDLVPYFDPGADSWDENTVNSHGGEAVVPSNNGKKKSKKSQQPPQQPQQSRRAVPPPNVPRQPTHQPKMSYEIQQPTPQPQHHQQQQQVQQPLQAKRDDLRHDDFRNRGEASANVAKAGPVPQRWAGPAFSNSPAPASLPVPSFAGGSKASALAATQPVAVPSANPGADIMQMLGQQTPPQRDDGILAMLQKGAQQQQQSPPQQRGSGGGGGDIMAMLQQGAQRTAAVSAASSSPPQPHHAASAPNLMAMLKIQPPTAPAPIAGFHRVPSAPVVAAAKSFGATMLLLTPERLAAMVAAKGAAGAAGGIGVKTPPQQPTEHRSKLLSMLGVGSSGSLAPPPLADSSSYAPKPMAMGGKHQMPPPPANDFALLLRKLESSA